ncbi:MAG TPA: DUF6121 family protein [Naasia sp.]
MADSAPAPRTPDARIVALLTTVAWVTVVVALFGLIYLVTGLDVVPFADAGPLLGPITVAIGGAILGLLCVRIVRAATPAGQTFVGAAAGVYLGMLLAGTLLYTVLAADPGALLEYPLTSATSPFTVGAAVLGGLGGLAARAVARSDRTGVDRPRWPWEEPGDE